MAALVVLVEDGALCRAEGGKIIASEDARLEATAGEEAKDPVEIV